jgi:hypothetical protein
VGVEEISFRPSEPLFELVNAATGIKLTFQNLNSKRKILIKFIKRYAVDFFAGDDDLIGPPVHAVFECRAEVP